MGQGETEAHEVTAYWQVRKGALDIDYPRGTGPVRGDPEVQTRWQRLADELDVTNQHVKNTFSTWFRHSPLIPDTSHGVLRLLEHAVRLAPSIQLPPGVSKQDEVLCLVADRLVVESVGDRQPVESPDDTPASEARRRRSRWRLPTLGAIALAAGVGVWAAGMEYGAGPDSGEGEARMRDSATQIPARGGDGSGWAEVPCEDYFQGPAVLESYGLKVREDSNLTAVATDINWSVRCLLSESGQRFRIRGRDRTYHLLVYQLGNVGEVVVGSGQGSFDVEWEIPFPFEAQEDRDELCVDAAGDGGGNRIARRVTADERHVRLNHSVRELVARAAAGVPAVPGVQFHSQIEFHAESPQPLSNAELKVLVDAMPSIVNEMNELDELLGEGSSKDAKCGCESTKVSEKYLVLGARCRWKVKERDNNVKDLPSYRKVVSIPRVPL